MKIEIIPAILEKSFAKIRQKTGIASGFLVQIDICDGRLTSDKTFLSGKNFRSFKYKFSEIGNITFEFVNKIYQRI